MLILESNTMYSGFDRLSTTNGSNILTSSAATSNLVANDVIKTNISSNAQTSLVISVADNLVTVNTVFTTNTSNIFYLAYPQFINVDYSVLVVS